MSTSVCALSSSPPSHFPIAHRPPSKTLTIIPTFTSRRSALISIATLLLPSSFLASSSHASLSDFVELPASGGVKALDLRIGHGDVPIDGDQIAIHYYGRLAAKQGWRFDSTYDHKDEAGDPVPFLFVLGSGKVISGIEAAVRSMRVGGVCRFIIPPSQGYQNTMQEPIPPNVLVALVDML